MIIRIAKEKFWIDTDFTECWPEVLLKLPPEIPTKKKYEVVYTYLDQDVDEQWHFHQHEVLGLFGAEHKNENEFVLHGCNFIKYAENGYLLSEDARQLCDAYMKNNQWEQRLLEQALRYSLRVRAIMAALMDGGALVSEHEFLTNMPQVTLKHENTVYYPFKYKIASTYSNLNTLLMEFKPVALGPFWRAELGMTEHQDFALYSGGIGTDPPSIDQIGLNLKPPFVLMHQLGWFTEKKDGTFVLNKRKIKKAIDAAVYKSLMNGKKATAKPVESVETVGVTTPVKPAKANATKATKKTTKAKATKAATSKRKTTKAKATKAVKSTPPETLPSEEVKPASAANPKTTKTAKSATKTKKAITSAKKTTTPAKAAKATKPTRTTKSTKPAAKTKATRPARSTKIRKSTPATTSDKAKATKPAESPKSAKPVARATKASRTAKSATRGKKAA